MEIDPETAARFTLERQHLIERAPPVETITVIDDILGLNAQGALNFQLSLWNRVSQLSHDFLPQALFEERSLVRSWLMRDTVHIIPASRLALYRAALKRPLMNEWNRWTVKTGKKESPGEWEPLYPLVLERLEKRPHTLNELQEEMGWSSQDDKGTLSRLVREMSLRGLLCHANSSGPWYHNTQHAFARVDRWLPSSGEVPPEEREALSELVRRYLRSYGPATVSDFSYWSGLKVRDAQPVFEAIRDSTEEISIMGQRRKCLILKEDINQLCSSHNLPPHARLLPQFDALIMGHKDKSRFMRSDDKKSIFLPRAYVAATILLDGRVEGVWKMRKKKKQWALELSTFRDLSKEEDEALWKEIEELRRFTGFEIVADIKPVAV
jgi:uncharacterized protein YcaQ